eukprot:11185961-Lingulodinium_polyedra.AAC.1
MAPSTAASVEPDLPAGHSLAHAGRVADSLPVELPLVLALPVPHDATVVLSHALQRGERRDGRHA